MRIIVDRLRRKNKYNIFVKIQDKLVKKLLKFQ